MHLYHNKVRTKRDPLWSNRKERTKERAPSTFYKVCLLEKTRRRQTVDAAGLIHWVYVPSTRSFVVIFLLMYVRRRPKHARLFSLFAQHQATWLP